MTARTQFFVVTILKMDFVSRMNFFTLSVCYLFFSTKFSRFFLIFEGVFIPELNAIDVLLTYILRNKVNAYNLLSSLSNFSIPVSLHMTSDFSRTVLEI